MLTKEQAEAAYTILVTMAGAHESDRLGFVQYAQTENASEWRFCGLLGFGGKYRVRTNTVDCYREDESKDNLACIKRVNKALRELEAFVTKTT